VADSGTVKSDSDPILHVRRDASIDLVTLARPRPTRSTQRSLPHWPTTSPNAPKILPTRWSLQEQESVLLSEQTSVHPKSLRSRRVHRLCSKGSATLRHDRIPTFPTIAAINGDTVGGDLNSHSLATIRIASERARFGLPEAQLGLIPGAGGTQRLAEVVGKSTALELMYSGRLIDATEAHALRLCARLRHRTRSYNGHWHGQRSDTRCARGARISEGVHDRRHSRGSRCGVRTRTVRNGRTLRIWRYARRCCRIHRKTCSELSQSPHDIRT